MRPEALVELGAGGRGARRRAAPAAPPRGFMGVEPELMDLGLCRREPRDEGCPHGPGAARHGVAVGSGLTGGIWVGLVRAGDKLELAPATLEESLVPHSASPNLHNFGEGLAEESVQSQAVSSR